MQENAAADSRARGVGAKIKAASAAADGAVSERSAFDAQRRAVLNEYITAGAANAAAAAWISVAPGARVMT